MTSCALHLEVVIDHAAQEFLLDFHCSIARRSNPDVVYSDSSSTHDSAGSVIQSVIWRFITPLPSAKGFMDVSLAF